jgi:hypothetical protein
MATCPFPSDIDHGWLSRLNWAFVEETSQIIRERFCGLISI